MKQLFVIMLVWQMTFISFAQNGTPMTEAQRDSVLAEISLRLENIEYRTEPVHYKLYKTDNIYTFLKLDTATGQIEQVQWSLDDNKEGTMIINSEDLSFFYKQPGSFELYPTDNMFQFILLDKALGRTWHVQWGMEANKRWIKRIY